jgi:hypothetical protein
VEPEVTGAIVGGAIALGSSGLTLLIQTRHADRHRFTTHRQQTYAEYYLISNNIVAQYEQLKPLLATRVVPGENAARSEGEEGAEHRRSRANELIQRIHANLLRMLELQSTLAMMAPYPLRETARQLHHDCTEAILGDSDAEKRLTWSQVDFVNLARKDLGITPWWKLTPRRGTWLWRVQNALIQDQRHKERVRRNKTLGNGS